MKDNHTNHRMLLANGRTTTCEMWHPDLDPAQPRAGRDLADGRAEPLVARIRGEMKQSIDLEMEWGYIGRGWGSGPRTMSVVRVEFAPYPPTLQYKLKYPRAAVLSVEGWNPIAVVPKNNGQMSGNNRSNFARFRKLFRETTGYRGKGLLEACQADCEAQLNGRYER